ncbi:MAG TPA: FtsH protease activity modulator HflK [Steroidobacteraceae bacterium]|nr:FtsH protease activity modulator HflK [Steroidobacteraceae bacterium]
MAWNEPGNRGESPWGKKRPAGKSGGSDNPLKDWQQKLQALLSGGSGDGSGGSEGPTAPGNFGLIIAAVLVVLWLVSGWFQINASDKGVVQRFGRFTEVRNEGWGWAFPWPIETVTKVNVSQVNSVEYRSRMLTADVNLVEIRSAIQYVNIDPVKVLFQVRDVEATLREVSESAIREVVGQASLDDVLGAARQRITDQTRERIQRTLDGYNSGLRISSVNFTDVQVPDAVVAAQRDANKAIEDRERYSKEALAYTNDILPKAEGAAQRQIQDAEAYKSQVVSLAEGDVARFNSIYAIYAQAPEVTRQRMYIEAIEQIMQQSKKIILDTKTGSGGNMIYLPLDKMLERNAARTTPAPAAAPVEELPTVTIDGRSRGAR